MPFDARPVFIRFIWVYLASSILFTTIQLACDAAGISVPAGAIMIPYAMSCVLAGMHYFESTGSGPRSGLALTYAAVFTVLALVVHALHLAVAKPWHDISQALLVTPAWVMAAVFFGLIGIYLVGGWLLFSTAAKGAAKRALRR